MYGFNPFADQVASIDQLVAQSGENEATVLRKLIDEALIARRKKTSDEEPDRGVGERSASEPIQALLLKIIRQGETSLRIQDVSLALLQDMYAESRAGRKAAWEQVAAKLKEAGMSTSEIKRRFESETKEARGFAYGEAKEIKRQQKK